MQQATSQEQRPRIFYGWWMLAITSWMSFFASGIFFRGFTVFVPALRDSLGISQAQTNLIFSLARAEGGLEGPFAGWMIDRFGNRRLLIPSVLLALLGYFALSQFVSGFWSFTLVYLLMVSLGNSIAFQHAMFAGINQWFRRRRSLAISILAAVSSLGGLFIVPSMNGVIEKWGWEMASLIAGVSYLVFLFPLCFLFRNKPEDMGLLPDGAATPPSTLGARGGAGRRRLLRDYTVREALHTNAYWLLMLGAGLRMIATLGILVSIIPILEDKGVSRQMAANLTGAMFGINFIARLAVGYLGDKWPKGLLLAVSLAAEAIAFVFLYFGEWNAGAIGIMLLVMFIILEGFGDGAGIIIWAALGDFFGRDRFATLRGYITFSHSWALVGSPVYVGWVFDHFGNYDWAIGPAAVCAGLASICFMLIRRPPQLTRASESDD